MCRRTPKPSGGVTALSALSGQGFPKTDEFKDDSGGRVSLFERGDIYFSGPTGIQVHIFGITTQTIIH